MKRCWILCAALVLLVGTAIAAPLSRTASKEPVEITADRLEADDVAKSLVFIGNAVAKQGDVTINSDRLTIYYAGQGSAAQGGDIDRIVADGSVRIVQGSRLATAGRAVYFRGEDRMVLTGSPKVTEGSNSVQGNEIILYLKENRSVVMGGQSGRVNAVFQPKKGTGR
ncbi:MAG: lipopolysaccharide transport periplasmic protein LptA [Deltaproteobacteria bacterium]|nr:MAG: lipopolysaccharide transport periplasmic protein LptA [Deltaproteobacteria bacterium]